MRRGGEEERKRYRKEKRRRECSHNSFDANYRNGNPQLTSNPYMLFFAGIFVLHYINRTIIFPLLVKSSSSSPSPSSKKSSMSILTVASAFGFQLVNCYLIFVSTIIYIRGDGGEGEGENQTRGEERRAEESRGKER